MGGENRFSIWICCRHRIDSDPTASIKTRDPEYRGGRIPFVCIGKCVIQDLCYRKRIAVVGQKNCKRHQVLWLESGGLQSETQMLERLVCLTLRVGG